MIESQAIKQLKDILGECTESDEAVCYVTNVDAPVLKIAINALGKQIPNKPNRWESGHACCCSCKRGIVREDNYCCYCGQRIDFESEM